MPGWLSTSASMIASSTASLVPDPIEKCAVCAASPSRMTLPSCQRSQVSRRNRSHAADPRKWAALLISRSPSRCAAKMRSHAAIVSSWLIAVEAKRAPRRGGAFDDEGRAIVGEAIGMRPDPARLGLLERKGEGLEQLRRAKPDEAIGALVDIDPERCGAGIAHAAVGAVGGDDQIPLRVVAGIVLAPEADRSRRVPAHARSRSRADACGRCR